jgi:hypothetical protein
MHTTLQALLSGWIARREEAQNLGLLTPVYSRERGAEPRQVKNASTAKDHFLCMHQQRKEKNLLCG